MTQPAFVERSRYYLAYEYPTKIGLAISLLDETHIWKRANADSNSIGNLMLHLAGNVRQWIVSGVGGESSDRDRAGEFAATGGYTKKELTALLTSSVTDADKALSRLAAVDLDRSVTIQGRDTTVFAAVYHVVEHFSMHTGQIIMLAKMYGAQTIQFYENAGGIAIPVWGGTERMSEKR
ncbi:MAG TPA: DUF1572 family protein [Gemmatimonadaceae bacterium]